MAAESILHACHQLVDQIGYWAELDETDVRGTLQRPMYNGKAGYNKELWQVWGQRFQDASNSDGISTSGKETARRAAEMMKTWNFDLERIEKHNTKKHRILKEELERENRKKEKREKERLEWEKYVKEMKEEGEDFEKERHK